MVDSDKRTPLILAAFNQDEEALRHLIEARADLNAMDNSGYSALAYAAKYESAGMCMKLINSGADVKEES